MQQNEPRDRPLLVRSAERADIAALTRILNHYIRETHITFNTEVVSEDARIAWLESFSPSGPHRLLVAAIDERVVGWASSHSLRSQAAYHRSVETSIYLDADNCGRGVGRALYSRLLDELRRESSVHRAFAGIALPNPASIALHERLGFEVVGTFREVGHKFGRYWDVRWYEKDLSGN